MYTHILVPTDGSDLSIKATRSAVVLAQKLGARITALTVTEPFPYSPLAETQPIATQDFFNAQAQAAQHRLQAVRDAAASGGVACDAFSVEAAQPWRAICDQATAWNTDLIVMASHGRKGFSALLLGSETQKVLTHSSIAVLVVR
jgi:nucleotide-binding universal stress UspA family protein